MKFEDLAFDYENKFNEKPPILTTVSVDDPLYLEMLREAIENNKPLTRNDLGAVFMRDDEAFY